MFSGSEEDYEQIVEENKRTVWLTGSKYLTNRSDIEDIVQETFIFAYFYYEKLSDKSKLKAWLCGIARNKSREFIRSNMREITPFDEMPEMPDLSTPELIYIEEEDKETLQKHISELSDEIAMTVRLRYFDGKSIDEIAQLLGIKVGTVKSRLHNARNKLELKLKGEYAMSENINSIIKESIKIAKEKIAQKIEEIEQKENSHWGDYWKLWRETAKDIKEQNMMLSEQDEVLMEGWEKSIESLLKKNDFVGAGAIYDLYSDFEFERDIGDYGLGKMLKAVEYSEKGGRFEVGARNRAHAEMIKKRLELIQCGKDIVPNKWRNGAIGLKKLGSAIIPSWHFANSFGDNTDFNIFGLLCPLYDSDWIPNRNGWQHLREYRDSDFKRSDEDFDDDGLIYKILFSSTPENVKIGDKIYKDCLHVVYRRELDRDKGDRFFHRFTSDHVWYALDVGIVKVNHITPMEDKITYLLDDYKVNGDGIGNKYMPVAEGNWWSYKAEGDNVADRNIYEYINKFTVTHADGNTAAVSHLGWIYER